MFPSHATLGVTLPIPSCVQRGLCLRLCFTSLFVADGNWTPAHLSVNRGWLMGSGLSTHITDLSAKTRMKMLPCTTLRTDHKGVSWERTHTLHSLQGQASQDPGVHWEGVPGRVAVTHTPGDISCRNRLSRDKVVHTARMEQHSQSPWQQLAAVVFSRWAGPQVQEEAAGPQQGSCCVAPL